MGFTLVYFTFHYIGFAKITLFQTSVCTRLNEVLKKYHPKCLSVRDAVTCKSYSRTLQSESILKLPRILCFWLMVSTLERLKKAQLHRIYVNKRHGQTNSASRTDVTDRQIKIVPLAVFNHFFFFIVKSLVLNSNVMNKFFIFLLISSK